MKERIERIEKIIFGNGKDGVLTKLARIETKLYFIYGFLIIIISLLIKLILK